MFLSKIWVSKIKGLISKTHFSTQKTQEKILSFKGMGLLSEINRVLEEQNILYPSPIQQKCIPKLLSSISSESKKDPFTNFIFSENGSGKTLTFSLPLLQILKSEEILANVRLTSKKKPRAIILIPNKELILQTKSVLKTFVHEIPLKIGTSEEELKNGVDVLITNIYQLQKMRKHQNVYFSNLSMVVLDEIDTFLECGYREEIITLLDEMKSQYNKRFLLLFVGSTMNPGIQNFIESLPEKRVFVNTNINQNLSNIKHEFIHLSDFDKMKPLGMLINELATKMKVLHSSTIIFCNSISSVRATEMHIATYFPDIIKTTTIHGDLPLKLRQSNFMSFNKRDNNLLISTDLCSRGLDFPFVYHIINFDFPKNIADYLQRAGRTGRGGREGEVLSFYRRKDLQVIEELKKSFDTHTPLKLKNSAFSLKNKENIIKERKEKKQFRVSKAASERNEEGYRFSKSSTTNLSSPSPIMSSLIKHKKEKYNLKRPKWFKTKKKDAQGIALREWKKKEKDTKRFLALKRKTQRSKRKS